MVLAEDDCASGSAFKIQFPFGSIMTLSKLFGVLSRISLTYLTEKKKTLESELRYFGLRPKLTRQQQAVQRGLPCCK